MTTAKEICDELVKHATPEISPDELIGIAEVRFGRCPELTLQRGIALAVAELRRLAAQDLAEADQLERYARAQ